MNTKIYESYPPDLSKEQQEILVQTVKDWTIQHGLTVRPSTSTVPEHINPHKNLATNAPVTLFPSPFPKACFEQARNLQNVYNELYASIASNEKWLESVMKELIQVDEFLENLWKIHVAVKEEGYTHELSLGMFRSDYMLHVPDDSTPPSLKQVEFNTISSSFGGLASLVTNLHTELSTLPAPSQSIIYPKHALFGNDNSIPIKSECHPPINKAIPTLTASLAAAHKAYGSNKSKSSLPLCVIFLVQDNERNLFDQLALSTHLYQVHQIQSFRLTTSKILTETSIPSKTENPTRPLIYTPPYSPSTKYEVTTVYFRALYAPTEYDSPKSWEARHHLERSAATKCPSVLLHLAGSKKIQQVLTSKPPGGKDHLSYFLPNHSKKLLDDLRSTFAPQYSLSEIPSEGVNIALNPKKAINHVLKPQREGGGNNIYRDNIPPFLKSIPESQYKQYILMELIRPPSIAKNIVLRSDGEVVSGNVISELGIFGTCLWRNDLDDKNRDTEEGEDGGGRTSKRLEILHNEEGGYLLRTKGKDSDEGGVAAGFSSLDSLILYEEA